MEFEQELKTAKIRGIRYLHIFSTGFYEITSEMDKLSVLNRHRQEGGEAVFTTHVIDLSSVDWNSKKIRNIIDN